MSKILDFQFSHARSYSQNKNLQNKRDHKMVVKNTMKLYVDHEDINKIIAEKVKRH